MAATKKPTYAELTERFDRLVATNEALLSENETLEATNKALAAENEQRLTENARIALERDVLREENVHAEQRYADQIRAMTQAHERDMPDFNDDLTLSMVDRDREKLLTDVLAETLHRIYTEER